MNDEKYLLTRSNSFGRTLWKVSSYSEFWSLYCYTAAGAPATAAATAATSATTDAKQNETVAAPTGAKNT